MMRSFRLDDGQMKRDDKRYRKGVTKKKRSATVRTPALEGIRKAGCQWTIMEARHQNTVAVPYAVVGAKRGNDIKRRDVSQPNKRPSKSQEGVEQVVHGMKRDVMTGRHRTADKTRDTSRGEGDGAQPPVRWSRRSRSSTACSLPRGPPRSACRADTPPQTRTSAQRRSS